MSKKILIIEDDVSIRELLVELLQTEGYEVLSAFNGVDGLRCLEQKTIDPDLILIDLMMPGMDGFKFREVQLKNSDWAKIPTIVMSAESDAKEKMKHLNITAFLSKPVEVDTILKTIARYC